MIVEKVYEIIYFKQSKWLEKCIIFNTQKRNQAVNDFEKDFYKLLKIALFGKTMENVHKRLEVEFVGKDDNEKIVKQQSKLAFNHLHKSYTNLIVTHSSKMKYLWINRFT